MIFNDFVFFLTTLDFSRKSNYNSFNPATIPIEKFNGSSPFRPLSFQNGMVKVFENLDLKIQKRNIYYKLGNSKQKDLELLIKHLQFLDFLTYRDVTALCVNKRCYAAIHDVSEKEGTTCLNLIKEIAGSHMKIFLSIEKENRGTMTFSNGLSFHSSVFGHLPILEMVCSSASRKDAELKTDPSSLISKRTTIARFLIKPYGSNSYKPIGFQKGINREAFDVYLSQQVVSKNPGNSA